MTDIQRKGRHSNVLHDMRIVSRDAMTNLDYIQILGQQVRKGNDARDIGPRVYTDEEERVSAINYLRIVMLLGKSSSLRWCLRSIKRICRRFFRLLIHTLGIGYSIDSRTFFEFRFFSCSFSFSWFLFPFVFLLFSLFFFWLLVIFSFMCMTFVPNLCLTFIA
jgi:hypothetical protein